MHICGICILVAYWLFVPLINALLCMTIFDNYSVINKELSLNIFLIAAHWLQVRKLFLIINNANPQNEAFLSGP